MKKQILIRCDGFSIKEEILDSKEEAIKKIKDEFDKMYAQLREEEYKEMSYCNDDEAALYNDGEDVYLWSRFEI